MTKQFHKQQRWNPLSVCSLSLLLLPSLFSYCLSSFVLNHCSRPRKLSLHTAGAEPRRQRGPPRSTPSIPAQRRQRSAPQQSIWSDWWSGLLTGSRRTETDVDTGYRESVRANQTQRSKQADEGRLKRQQAARPSSSCASPTLMATPAE